jgi:hypothetical protein
VVDLVGHTVLRVNFSCSILSQIVPCSHRGIIVGDSKSRLCFWAGREK